MTKEALLRIAKNTGVIPERWEEVCAYAYIVRRNKEGDDEKLIYVVFLRGWKSLGFWYEIRGESIEDYTTENFTKISEILK